MALQKKIVLKNGVTTNYHRIVSLNFVTNWSTTIEVRSYVSKEGRDIEQQYEAVQKKVLKGETLTQAEQRIFDEGAHCFMYSEYFETEYDEEMSVKNAYEYLKTIDKYKDAIDI